MPAHGWLTLPVIAAYLAAALFYVAEVFFRKENASSRGRIMLIGAATLQGLALLGHAFARGAGLFGDLFEIANAFVWLMVVVFLVAERRGHMIAAGVFVAPLAFAISVFMLAAHSRIDPAQSLDKRWLLPHVGAVLLGYTALALAVCFALLYLSGERLLKTKHPAGVLKYFPSLDTADHLVIGFTAFGLSMLTAGIVSGVLWSYERAHTSPWTDARTVQSLLAWFLFALYLFVRKVVGWQGSRAKWVIVFGFAVLVVTMVSYRIST